MSKYGKEILIGTIPVLVIFLAYIGVNIVPLLFVGFIGTMMLLMLRQRGGIGAAAEKKMKRAVVTSKISFDEIGGQDRAKQEIIEAMDFLIKHEEIKKMGIRPLKGILLTGPPGTGKTLLAKAAAHYTDSVFIAASGSEFVEMYVGVGAGRIRDLFKDACSRAHKEGKESAIVFIDEIDVIGGKRDGGQHKEYDQTLNQLLTEMDGIHTGESPRIMVIAATNRKEILDPALLRPGRFDRHIQVDLPDKKGRRHILSIHAANKPLADDVDLDKIAEETYRFSGAMLESVMNEGAIYAMRDGSERIEQKHLALAIDKVMLGEQTDRETNREEKKRVALHELGHALMAELLRPNSVSQVSLRPRGGALGYVRHNPQKEQYLYTQTYLEEQIMISLAGSVAEEMFYGGRSTGSRNDFEQAMEVVKVMIESGLTSLGIVQREMITKDEWAKVNNEILDELTERTRTSLEPYRSVFLDSLEILMHEEVMSGERFREMLHSMKQPAQQPAQQPAHT